MTLREAKSLLDATDLSVGQWKPNPALTLEQAGEILRKALPTLEWDKSGTKPERGDDDDLGPIGVKRVWQVVKNQSRPRY